MDNVREKMVDVLTESFDAQYNQRQLITPVHTADHLIRHGVTVQEWISVEDRLPEEDTVDTYLVVVEEKYAFDDKYRRHVDVATFQPWREGYIDEYWNTFNDWDEGQEHLHVTHWMPLPPAPKGE